MTENVSFYSIAVKFQMHCSRIEILLQCIQDSYLKEFVPEVSMRILRQWLFS